MSILKKLFDIKELPTLPEIVLKIRELITSEKVDAYQVARVIESDPSISAKILKIANSAFFYPLNQRITSLPLAVTRIGFREAGNIAMTMSFIKEFSKKKSITGYRRFWRHSVELAYFAERLLARSGFTQYNRHEVYTAGLLHDIGILVYDQFFPEIIEKIMECSCLEEKTFLMAENKVIPKETHPVVGSALLEFWKMHPIVVCAVRFHHQPLKAPQNCRQIASIIYLSEYVANMRLGSFEGSMDDEYEQLWQELRVDKNMAEQIRKEIEKEISELAFLMGED